MAVASGDPAAVTAGGAVADPGTEVCPIPIARTSRRLVSRGFVRSGCHALPMPRTSSPAGLAGLLEQPTSVVRRGQLLALGMKDSAMQYRVRRGGPWQILLPGVYLTASGVPSLSQKEVAALLYAGPGSLITPASARCAPTSARCTPAPA